MVHLSFFEEIADKASRLLPTPYMEIVEECTKPELSVPPYDHVYFLCKSANNKPDAIVDIVRALRRRISDDNFAVKHLMVLLLDVMVRSCGLAFHAEVCSQKGLLRDLVAIATSIPIAAREVQARRAALTLVLNLSIWFAGHPDVRCRLLSTLANDVRQLAGPNAFDDITPNVNTRIHLGEVPPDSGCAEPPTTGGGRGGAGGPSRAARGARRNPCAGRGGLPPDTVHAIAIDLPTEEKISAMLDTCVALSEYVDNAQVDGQGNVIHDAVVVGFLRKVQEDHNYVAILLSSNLNVDREVLRAIRDSQANVIERVQPRRTSQGGLPVSPPLPTPPLPTEKAGEGGAETADIPPQESRGGAGSEGVQAAPDIDEIFSTPEGSAMAPSTANPAPPSQEGTAGEAETGKKDEEMREGSEGGSPGPLEREKSEHVEQNSEGGVEQQQPPQPEASEVAAEAATTDNRNNVPEVSDETK